MATAESLLQKLAKRELRFRLFRMLNAPGVIIRDSQSSIEKAKEMLACYEGRHGKISMQAKKEVYLDCLTAELGRLTLAQLKVQCENCTYFYKNAGELPGPEDIGDFRSAGESEIEALLDKAEKVLEKGCPLHFGKPIKMTSSEKCPDYSPFSANAESYDNSATGREIEVVREFIAEVSR